jgi:lipopolysaccharide biosynthesis protein
MRRSVQVAIVAHLYYEEMWPELAHYIRQIPPPAALYVTVPPRSSAISHIRKSFPKAEILTVEDVGRDVLPFLLLLPELQQYTAVCKVHSKKDPLWRRILLDGVAADRDLARRIIEAFKADPLLGMVGAQRTFIKGVTSTWGRTQEILNETIGQLPPDFGFFAGTIFWVRPAFVSHLASYFPPASFVPHSDRDGHPEHALERMFGVEMTKDGRRIGTVDEARRLHIAAGTYSASVLTHINAPLRNGR